MIVTQRISIAMDAILSLGGASAVLTGLSPISSSDFHTNAYTATRDVPSGAILAVFYSVGFMLNSDETFISLSPISVAVPSSGSIDVIATGIKSPNEWETGTTTIATLSSTSLEIPKKVSGMVLWLG